MGKRDSQMGEIFHSWEPYHIVSQKRNMIKDRRRQPVDNVDCCAEGSTQKWKEHENGTRVQDRPRLYGDVCIHPYHFEECTNKTFDVEFHFGEYEIENDYF